MLRIKVKNCIIGLSFCFCLVFFFFLLPIHSVSTVPFYSGDNPIPSVIIERTERTK